MVVGVLVELVHRAKHVQMEFVPTYVHPVVLEEIVELMVVEVLVEPALEVINVSTEFVLVSLVALEGHVELMVVVVLVVFAQLESLVALLVSV